jgi:hypothetical protein
MGIPGFGGGFPAIWEKYREKSPAGKREILGQPEVVSRLLRSLSYHL